jgi:hypothetical protein
VIRHLNSLFIRWIFKYNLKIHHNSQIFLHPKRINYKETVAHLQHKWCVHSILPVAPRVKQPVHFNTQNISYSTEKGFFCVLIVTFTHKHMHTQYTGLWNSTGFIWQPEEASGVDLTCCCGFCSRSC